jgi:predicted Zn-dependent protease with MMP-like domain
MRIAREQFDRWVAEAIEMAPKRMTGRLGRLVFVVDDHPTQFVVKESRLRRGYLLMGYYQGFEQIGRRNCASSPDRIFIFRQSFLDRYKTVRTIKSQVMKTVWHELSHHFGADEAKAEKAEKQLFERYSRAYKRYRVSKREIKKAAEVKKIRQGYKRRSKVTFRVEKIA